MPTRPSTAPFSLAVRELPDEEVARRVVAGETELFELLLRRYNQRLFRIVRGAVDSDLEAEDVLQDAWVRAFEHLAEFRGEARLSTWLARIALHEAWARLRRGRRFVELLGEDDPAAPRHGDPDPEQRALVSELRVALERAVAAMPRSARAVFLLREVEGLSTEATAELLELTPGAVKVRLHRARAGLRADLDRRLGSAARELFRFDGARCDRTVAAVFARLGAGGPADQR